MTTIVTRTDNLASANASTTVKGSQLTHTELDRNFYPIKISTDGTIEASKAIVVDANKDFTGARNGTFTGTVTADTLTATTLTVSGVLTGSPWAHVATLSTTGTTQLGETTAISSTATIIKLIFNGVSTSTNVNLFFEMNDDAAYDQTIAGQVGNNGGNSAMSSGQYQLVRGSGASSLWHGDITLSKQNTGNLWTGKGTLGDSASNNGICSSAGTFTLNGAPDRLKVVVPSGTFDAGYVEVWEFTG